MDPMMRQKALEKFLDFITGLGEELSETKDQEKTEGLQGEKSELPSNPDEEEDPKLKGLF